MPPKNVRRLDPAEIPDMTETGIISLEKELIDRVFRDGPPKPAPKSEKKSEPEKPQEK